MKAPYLNENSKGENEGGKKISFFVSISRKKLYLQFCTEEDCIQEISKVGARIVPDRDGDGNPHNIKLIISTQPHSSTFLWEA